MDLHAPSLIAEREYWTIVPSLQPVVHWRWPPRAREGASPSTLRSPSPFWFLWVWSPCPLGCFYKEDFTVVAFQIGVVFVNKVAWYSRVSHKGCDTWNKLITEALEGKKNTVEGCTTQSTSQWKQQNMSSRYTTQEAKPAWETKKQGKKEQIFVDMPINKYMYSLLAFLSLWFWG